MRQRIFAKSSNRSTTNNNNEATTRSTERRSATQYISVQHLMISTYFGARQEGTTHYVVTTLLSRWPITQYFCKSHCSTAGKVAAVSFSAIDTVKVPCTFSMSGEHSGSASAKLLNNSFPADRVSEQHM